MADFEVTALQQTQQLDDTGHMIDAVTVTFTLPGGVASGFVTVPMTGDWQDAALVAAQARADELQAFLDAYNAP